MVAAHHKSLDLWWCISAPTNATTCTSGNAASVLKMNGCFEGNIGLWCLQNTVFCFYVDFTQGPNSLELHGFISFVQYLGCKTNDHSQISFYIQVYILNIMLSLLTWICYHFDLGSLPLCVSQTYVMHSQ